MIPPIIMRLAHGRWHRSVLQKVIRLFQDVNGDRAFSVPADSAALLSPAEQTEG